MQATEMGCPVANRDVMPHANAACPRCKGRGEIVMRIDRTRRSGKYKRGKAQPARFKAMVRLCPCGLQTFVKLQRVRVAETGQLFALEPFTAMTEESLKNTRPMDGPIHSKETNDVG